LLHLKLDVSNGGPKLKAVGMFTPIRQLQDQLAIFALLLLLLTLSLLPLPASQRRRC
jgi:hypothetical protein